MDPERQQKLNWLYEQLFLAADQVHGALGRNLPAETYHECFAHELELMGRKVQRDVAVPILYRDHKVDRGVVIPLIVMGLRTIKRHYVEMDQRMAAAPLEKVSRRTNTVVVLVGRVTKGSLTALAYARSLNPDKLVSVTVVSNPEEQERINTQWEEHGIQVDLVSLYSPYRELTRPIIRYIDDLDAQSVDDFVTVVVPEFNLDRWWHHFLHNQSALVLRTRLRGRPNTIVTSVPFHVDPVPA